MRESSIRKECSVAFPRDLRVDQFPMFGKLFAELHVKQQILTISTSKTPSAVGFHELHESTGIWGGLLLIVVCATGIDDALCSDLKSKTPSPFRSSTSVRRISASKTPQRPQELFPNREHEIQTDLISQVNSVLELFEFETLVHLETRRESHVGKIEELLYLHDQNRIVVLDHWQAGEVLVFDCAGKYLFALGKRGAGPEEHGLPEAMAYENGLVVFYSFPPQKLQWFSVSDGTLEKEISFTALNGRVIPYKFSVLQDEIYLYTSNTEAGRVTKSGDHYRIYRFKDTEFTNGYGKTEYQASVSLGSIAVFHNAIVYSGTLNGNIYRIDPSTDREVVFCTFLDLANNNRSVQPFDDYFPKHHDSWFQEVSSIGYLWPIGNLLLVGKQKAEQLEFAILNRNGEIVRDHLPLHGGKHPLKNRKVMEKVFSSKMLPSKIWATDVKFSSWYDGLVESAFFETEDETSQDIANPRLLVYKLKDLTFEPLR